MKQIIFLLVSIIMISFAACKDKTPAPELPPYTETGENTFGCYVDGVPYAIWDHVGGFFGPWFYINENNLYKTIDFTIKGKDNKWSLFISIIDSSFSTGIYKTNGYPGAHLCNATFMSDNMPSGGSIYESSPDVYLTITLNKAIKGSHYAGTFEGELVNGDGKIIKITEGRFDSKRK